MARKVGTLVLTLVASLGCAGCMGRSSTWAYPHAHSESIGRDADEHHEQVARALERDRRSLSDDLDLLYQTDRPTRLSKWHGR